jgi:type IV pilus assembly protein PilA
MSSKSDLLKHTRPLSDPLQTITILTIAIAVVLGVIAWPGFGIWAALGMTLSALSFTPLFAPLGKPNAIYLRAFRTDKATEKLRAELAAILGPAFRLTGIRPPRERSSVFMHFLLPGIVAMKYAGSRFMELEAGDDWMARLWKTYQTTRLVFIDIREMTPFVHQEIQLTLQTVEASRSVFVVDQQIPEQERRHLVAEIAGPECDPAQLQLLDVSPERIPSRQIEADLKQILNRLPIGVPGELDRGRQFVLEHVSEELLKKSQRVSALTIIAAIVALVLAGALGVLWAMTPHDKPLFLVLLAVIVVPVLVLWIGGMVRLAARAMRLGRAGHPGGAVRAWLLLALALILLPAGWALNVVQTVWGSDAPLVRTKKMAFETSAILTLRTLNQAEIMYDSMYPDNGYACSLSPLGGNPNSGSPTALAAQIIPDDLASTGMKSGYRFAFSDCTKAKVDGQIKITGYKITAVPISPGRPPSRGFCTDESGEIRFDPGGGANCTEPLE